MPLFNYVKSARNALGSAKNRAAEALQKARRVGSRGYATVSQSLTTLPVNKLKGWLAELGVNSASNMTDTQVKEEANKRRTQIQRLRERNAAAGELGEFTNANVKSQRERNLAAMKSRKQAFWNKV